MKTWYEDKFKLRQEIRNKLKVDPNCVEALMALRSVNLAIHRDNELIDSTSNVIVKNQMVVAFYDRHNRMILQKAVEASGPIDAVVKSNQYTNPVFPGNQPVMVRAAAFGSMLFPSGQYVGQPVVVSTEEDKFNEYPQPV